MSFKPVVKGLGIATLSLLVLALAGSLLYTYGPISTESLPAFSHWLLFLSLLFGATAASSLAGCKGLLYGLAVTLPLVFLLTFFGWISAQAGSLSYLLLPKLLLACIAGILGGVLGAATSLAP